MYRIIELRLFTVLSVAANIFAILALLIMLAYHFYERLALYRDAAFIAIIFSGFFKVQIFMYKVMILEKRMLHLTEPSLQHFKLAMRRDNVDLVVYLVLFWLVLIGCAFSFILSS